jgi:hypothetical protein
MCVRWDESNRGKVKKTLKHFLPNPIAMPMKWYLPRDFLPRARMYERMGKKLQPPGQENIPIDGQFGNWTTHKKLSYIEISMIASFERNKKF